MNPAATLMLVFFSLLVAPAVIANDASIPTAPPSTAVDKPCNWWVDRERCPEAIEGLPPEASRAGAVITIDTSRDRAYLFVDGQPVASGKAATGMNKMLTKGSRQWLFRTPRGRMEVLRKITDPIWTKPDWAFVEEGKKIPPADSPTRKQRGKLGKYALDLGEGILIHGTDDPKSIGKKVSHGCIRLGAGFLTKVYKTADVGTEVWVF